MRARTVIGACLGLLAACAPAHAASRPDLSVTSLSAPGSAAAGSRITVADTTRNRRATPAGRSTTRHYLSRDRRKSRGDVRLGKGHRVKRLRGRAFTRGFARPVIPVGTAARSYFLLACADDLRRVREANERNNCRARALRVTVSGGSTMPPPATAGDPPVIGGCRIFPPDNPWNRDISADPVDPLSTAYLSRISGTEGSLDWNLRQDWGADEEFYGIPFAVVPESQGPATITFGTDGEDYSDESDPGPYPFPHDIHIEGGSSSDPNPSSGDRHAIAIQQGSCILFETFNTERTGSPGSPSFRVSSSAKWDLKVNATRPATWTSADAAGLPILPGLARVDEVLSGKVTHALRFTGVRAQKAYIAPAGHYGPNEDPCLPPYGMRVRLKAGFDLSGYTGQARVILEGLKRYGLMFADQGSAGYLSGTSDPRWDIDNLTSLRNVKGSDLEVVQSGTVVRGYSTSGCSG